MTINFQRDHSSGTWTDSFQTTGWYPTKTLLGMINMIRYPYIFQNTTHMWPLRRFGRWVLFSQKGVHSISLYCLSPSGRYIYVYIYSTPIKYPISRHGIPTIHVHQIEHLPQVKLNMLGHQIQPNDCLKPPPCFNKRGFTEVFKLFIGQFFIPTWVWT